MSTAVKTEIWDITKKNLGIVLIGIVFLILYFSGCHSGSASGKNTIDTVTHTTQVLQPIIVNPPVTPQQEGKTTYLTIPTQYKGVVPASTVEELVAQVKDLSAKMEALAKEYYASKNYADSIQLKDTTGKRVGVVNLKQRVSENTLQETQSSYQLLFPHTVTTITNTIYPKPKNKIYMGLGVESLIGVPKIQAIDAGVALQNKSDNIFQVSLTYNLPVSSAGIRLAYLQKLHFK